MAVIDKDNLGKEFIKKYKSLERKVIRQQLKIDKHKNVVLMFENQLKHEIESKDFQTKSYKKLASFGQDMLNELNELGITHCDW